MLTQPESQGLIAFLKRTPIRGDEAESMVFLMKRIKELTYSTPESSPMQTGIPTQSTAPKKK